MGSHALYATIRRKIISQNCNLLRATRATPCATAVYVWAINRYGQDFLKRWVSTVAILLNHVQTIGDAYIAVGGT